MQTIGPPDVWHISAAIGWLELGNPAEARAELVRVEPSLLANADVLEVRWAIEAHDEDWNAALYVARELVRSDPSRSSGWLHQAYALRRVSNEGLQAAWDALRPAADHFSAEPIIPYNLSCYACQMGRLQEARDWLRRAMQIGGKGKIKPMALADPDLQALWREIGAW